MFMSKSINDALESLPELSEAEKHRRTLAALADVEAGRTIGHDELKAHIRSVREPEATPGQDPT